MRRINKFSLGAVTLTLALLLIVSCRKNPCPPNPQNVQVVSSEWMSAEFNNQSLWTKKVMKSGSEFMQCEFSTPGITENLLKNASILVYAKFYGYNQDVWADEKIGLLPKDIFHFLPGGSLDCWSASVEPGKVTINVINTSGSFPWEINSENVFRIIAVPKAPEVVTGSKPVGSTLLAQYTEGELRELSYDQLCNQAGLSK